MSEEMKKHVESLIEKAAQAEDGAEAMRFSQAATNAANALATLGTLIFHASDCALHNAPALEPGPCDCGAASLLAPKERTEG